MVHGLKDTTLTVSNSGFVTDKIPSHRSVLPQLSLRTLDLSPLNSHSAGSTGKKAELLPCGSSTMAGRVPRRSERQMKEQRN